VLSLYNELEQKWNELGVPPQHRVHFIEGTRVLDLKVMQSVFEKELSDFEKVEAPI